MGSWLSELPDDIIHSIITNHLVGDPNLTNKTVVRYGLLSKDISRALQRRPALCFQWNNAPGCKKIKEQELKYVVSTLIRYNSQNIHLGTFKISASDRYISGPVSDDHSRFDRCIQQATTNRKGLINLHMQMWGSYVWPQAVLLVESLVHLDLSGGVLHLESIIKWSNLKSLHLSHVRIGEGVFENMIRRCPLIEILEISICVFNMSDFHIHVSDLCYLNQLSIRLAQSQTFQLDSAPNLESFAFGYPSAYPYQVDLVKYAYHKLRRLSVCSLTGFDDDFFTNMEHQFPLLEKLYILHTRIKRINISSSSLKKIKFKYTGLEEVTLDVPNIVLFKYCGKVVPTLSLAGNSGAWISRIKFKISNANIDTLLFLKMKQFLAAINMPEASITVSFREGIMYFHIVAHPRLSADSISFPGTVRHLTIRAFSEPFARKVVDGIFLIFHPQEITLEDWDDGEFPKLLHDNLMGLTTFKDHHLGDPSFQHLMWNVTQIDIGLRNEDWHQGLKVPQVLDELFRVDHHGDRKHIFTIVFKLKYYWRPGHNMIMRWPLRFIFRFLNRLSTSYMKHPFLA